MNDATPVPAAAELLRDFVNTYEPQVDEELLESPEALAAWLAERSLLSPDAQLSSSDVAAASAVREGLRAILLGHAGHPTDTDAVQRLNETLRGLPVHVTLTGSTDGFRLDSASNAPFAEAMARLADAIRASIQEGSWPRLKACSRETCHWAYYDASRNQVRRWCSMAGCGNHIKMRRAYAARKDRERRAASSARAPEEPKPQDQPGR